MAFSDKAHHKKAKFIVLLLLIILSYPFLIKYAFVLHNQFESLPLILRFNNPAFLISDWAVNADAALSPRIFFTAYMGTLARFIPLTLAYFLNYLIMVTLVALPTYLLSQKLFRSPWVSLLTTAPVLYGQEFTLGGNDLMGRDFDPSRLAFGLVFLGFIFLLNKKYKVAAILFAIACYLNPLIGTEGPAILYGIFFLKKFFLPVMESVILYLILAGYSLFAWITPLLSVTNDPTPKNILTTIFARVRLPQHYLPSTWPFETYFYFFVFVILAFIIYKTLRNKFPDEVRKVIFPACGIIFFLCIIGFIFTEIIPVYFVTIAQLFRLTVVAYWFLAAILYGGCYFLFINRSNKRSLSSLFIVLIPLLLSNFVIVIPIIKLFLEIVAMSISLVIITTAFYTKLSNKNIAHFFFLICVIGILVFPYRHYKIEFSSLYPFRTPEIDIAEYAKNHTPTSALFLTPPEFMAFRLNSNRAIVADWFLMPFTPKGMVEWISRLKNISGENNIPDSQISEVNLSNGYESLNMERIISLEDLYHFKYLIVTTDHHYPLSIIYQNERFVIYQIK
jgi:hypothetical protein